MYLTYTYTYTSTYIHIHIHIHIHHTHNVILVRWCEPSAKPTPWARARLTSPPASPCTSPATAAGPRIRSYTYY
ncbi:hypothetical protein EON63_23695 [archaeon]|nr:MAG: hypothetical protein EON63_23695 [archaeon]